MCSSYPENIHVIIHAIADAKPESVLDIGVGNGKYGFLIKEYFSERNGPNSWPHIKKLGGVEAHEGYIQSHHSIYKPLMIGDVFKKKIPKYDLYLLVDVLEHWPKDKARELIEKLMKNGKVLISTPKIVETQEVAENPYEKHVSQWYPGDFTRYNHIDYSPGTPSHIYLIW